MKMGSKTKRAFGALLAAGVVATGAYALTAGNTVPASRAGDGSGTISGYVVTNVKYTLNSTDPGNIDAVTFTLDAAPPAGATTKIQLSSGGAWYSCTSGTPATNQSCATTSPSQATVTGATELRVVSAQ
jgi:hypothetical protein